MKIQANGGAIQSIHQIASQTSPVKSIRQDGVESFSTVLDRTLEQSGEVKLSKHAALRLEARQIHLSQEQMGKLRSAVDKAAQKGVKDSLVVMDEVAFVVNVGARTVITAVNTTELKDNVFTQIDGAVFA